MRRFIAALALVLAGFSVLYAQNYGSDWVNTSAPHYKFKIISKGLYRISGKTLKDNGIPADQLVGERFRLFFDGKEVPLYVTNNGLFTDDDFIEFLGDKNRGAIDTELYLSPEFQPNPDFSLFTDTATMFLAIYPTSGGLRMEPTDNDLTNLPAAEQYYYHTSTVEFTSNFIAGENPNQVLNFVFDSNFDVGEGFAGTFIGAGQTRIVTVPTPFRYTTGDLPFTLFGTFGFVNNSTRHEVEVRLIQTPIFTLTSNRAGIERFNYQGVVSALAAAGTQIRFSPSVPNERNVVYTTSIRYPRLFNFGAASRFSFSVAKTDRAYVQIANFDAKTTNPVIYDLKNRQRYIGVISGTNVNLCLKETSALKDSLFISSQSPDDVQQINTLQRVNWPRVEDASQHGNYIIITHKSLINNGQGVDYVKAFADYRKSAAGGSNTVAVYYIDELEDMYSWGVRTHPLAIRNFINYAVDNFSVKPEQIFIIGKGLSYNRVRNDSSLFAKSLIPTWGEPSSDMLFTSRNLVNNTPQVGIGRLSVSKGDDINVYLQKVIDYENFQKFSTPDEQTLDKKEWMKNVLHLGGGNFLDEQITFARYLESYRRIIEGPFYGATVNSIYKNTTDPVQIAQSAFLDSLILKGISLITFFGHSSTSTVDFNLEPENFKNTRGKYPMMLTNGCFVGNIFENFNSYSERFVLTPDRCAIGYIAPMTFAIAFSLNQYATNFYNRMGIANYANPIGTIMKNTATDVFSSSLSSDKILGQQMIYHGDPLIKVGAFTKPDYVLTEQNILFDPSDINASTDSFKLKVIAKNIGKAVSLPYTVSVDRLLPNGELESYEIRKNAAFYGDTIVFNIKTNNLTGLGQNTFTIKLDSENEIDEYSELNNEVTINRFFITDNVLPVYPPEFAIVNQDRPVLSFSTANPFLESRQYILQLDTTEFFSSPLLLTTRITQSGGIINWSTNANLIPGRVYYWRGSLDTLYGNPLSWNNSSFLYNPDLSPGWNQSHYFQYLDNSFNTMLLPDSRQFRYIDNIRTIDVINGTDALGANSRVLFLDNSLIARNAFDRRGYLFFVLDTKTGKPMSTYQVGTTGFGIYGNIVRTLLTDIKIIEFNTTEQKGRYSCYFFIKNAIPDQAIVCGYSFGNPEYLEWSGDDSTVFNGETLFDAFESIGITRIRNQVDGNPFVFFTQKGNPFFETIQVEAARDQIIDTTFVFSGTWNAGSMISPLIGPSDGWNTIDYNWTSLDNPSTDNVVFDLYGYSAAGDRIKLLNNFQKNADISFVNADVYPYIQMEMTTEDKLNSTAPQLDYWRVIYEEVPEGAINPQKAFVKGADTILLGGNYKCAVAFENITNKDMDSVLVKFTVRDAANNREVFYKRFARLPGKQYITIDFDYTFSKVSTQGLNTISFEANPDNDQKEQLHFNNFAFFNVFVLTDITNPLLDVTFDGRHITDGEIVSPTPEILVRLKDENKFLALNDTSAFRIFLKVPNSSTFTELDPRSSAFTFVPADPSQIITNNEAKLFYKPDLPEDGEYELRVQAADRSKNDAGKNEYRISFKVDRRPAISNVLNYPNPFSTSTQFVFTLTGAEVPSEMKIQIMTVTGKVVKEITRDELGDIRIGNNITNYRWDGTDTYGDRLANGLYLYRVVAKMNGQQMDMINTSADKYFKKGFGKMYIVR